uniref:Uncharacterized protein n=1 Tax=Pithovirus LCPAC403 TaxID=2506596 RepID=A0A481ZAX4_9VIRU|nr:MAG: hypothetical protein LCPAC403_00610 [Pithovirus LCPAC403]
MIKQIFHSTNISFDLILQEDSFWRRHILNSHDISEKIEETWKEQAKVTFLKSRNFWNVINGFNKQFFPNSSIVVGNYEDELKIMNKIQDILVHS